MEKKTKKVSKKEGHKKARERAKRASFHFNKFCEIMDFGGMQRVMLMKAIVEVSIKGFI